MTKQEKYTKEQKKFGKFLAKEKYAGKVLKQHGYEIFDIHQANEDFRKVMKLDEITEIAGVYVTKEKQNNGRNKTIEHIESITKANFWNAFYLPIWKNLQDNEKIKSLEWFFETENEKRNLGIKGIGYFPAQNGFENCAGYFDYDKKYLYLDLCLLDPEFPNIFGCWKDGANFALMHFLAHELMHARQGKYVKNFKPLKMPADLYTLSQSHVLLNDYTRAYDFNSSVEHAILRASLPEKVAELQGLKLCKKFLELNEKKFGVDQIGRKIFEKYKRGLLFTKLVYNKKKKQYNPAYGIFTDEKIILKGQRDNLLKLIMLKNIYEYDLYYYIELYDSELYESRSVSKDKKISKDEMSDRIAECKKNLTEYKAVIQRDEEKLALIKSTFFKTLETGKLPEEFNEKEEFEILNLVEEKNNEYIFPKWLRKDEIKYNDMIKEK